MEEQEKKGRGHNQQMRPMITARDKRVTDKRPEERKDKQTDRQTDRETNRKRNRKTEKPTQTLKPTCKILNFDIPKSVSTLKVFKQ